MTRERIAAALQELDAQGLDEVAPGILNTRVPGSRALAIWEALAARAEELEAWPVILLPPWGRDLLAELSEWPEWREGPSSIAAQMLREAAPLIDSIRAQRASEREGVLEGPGRALLAWMRAHPAGGSEASLREALAAPRARVVTEPRVDASSVDLRAPRIPPAELPGLHHWQTGEIVSEVSIVLVPTARAWEALAWLPFGGFNACPGPLAHLVKAWEWHERYGARLCAIAADTLDYSVDRPPADPDEVVALAAEQAGYCSDLGDIEHLAATLRGRRFWHFWWD